MVMFGHFLDTLTQRIKKEHPDHRFLLASREGVIGTDLVVTEPLLRQQRIHEALQTATASIDFDDSQDRNLYYTPIDILNQTLCLVVPIDLESTRKVLANSRQRMVQALFFILFVLLVASYGLNVLVLAPLRRLHEKAVLMVEVCSAGDPDMDHFTAISNNEIVMLRQALEAATIKLYGHLEKLRISNSLLQKLALKDPVTDLLNRRMFVQLLQRSLNICGRNDHQVVVMLLELDRFPEMEVLLSPLSRDQLIKEVTQRLQKCLRDEDLLCRLDKNNFGAFIPQCCGMGKLSIITLRIQGAMRQAFLLE